MIQSASERGSRLPARRYFHSPGRLLWAAMLICICPCSVRADKPAPPADLAVDQISVRGGPRLLGAILGREADGAVAMAVGRDWLKKSHLRFYEDTLRQEAAETRAALTELRDRIDAWRKARSEDKELDFFLRKEAERIEMELAAIDAGKRDEDAPFMVVDLAPAKIDRVVNQPLQRKSIAATAWHEGLPDVETRSTTSLAQELKKQKIEPADDPDLLLDLLPPRRQNDAAWAARKAIVEYRYRKPLDFQGIGDQVLRTGDDVKAADVGQLIAGLLKGIGDDPLGDLFNPQGGKPQKKTPNANAEQWLETAASKADEEGLTGFRVTRTAPDMAAGRASVETRFVARLSDGSWKTVWQRTETADTSKARPDVEQQIEKDPQVRTALELFKAIGLGGEEQIRLAIRFGAATFEAQKAADSRFFEFRDRHLRRLDGPVLRVAPVPAATATK